MEKPNTQIAATAPQPTVPATAAATAPATQDVYAKWGISKYNPDGSKKSDSQLRDELRKVALEQKKKQNPNYGSVFNLPNVWSD